MSSHRNVWSKGRRTTSVSSVLAAVLFVSLGSTAFGQAADYYVDDSASPGGNGLSWATAFDDLELAVAAAFAGDIIWVAEGTYLPSNTHGSPDPREATFLVREAVEVYGGFDGTETLFSERAGRFRTTILTGNIQNPNLATDNAYHVVRIPGGGFVATTRIDGFTIVDGRADGSPPLNDDGGGIQATNADIFIANCTFRDNVAVYGGGMSALTCLLKMKYCSFAANIATEDGGGLYLLAAKLSYIYNTYFNLNLAEHGGAIWVSSPDQDILFYNDQINDNSADLGGGVYLAAGSHVDFWNCTVAYNATTTAAGGGGFYVEASNTASSIGNTVVWANTGPVVPTNIEGPGAAPLAGPASDIPVTFCDVGVLPFTSTYPGVGNINVDPQFVNGPARNLRLNAGSPCNDAGTDTLIPPDYVDLDDDMVTTTEPTPFDLRRKAREQDDPTAPDTGVDALPFGTIVDIGAYER